MRLMNTTTFKLAEFNEDCVPVYAILSHTWNTEELTYKMVTDLSDWDTRKGAAKVLGACRKVAGHNIPYIWIDTCCIDKSSSAELTEAINSMFKWYKGAKECLVYLSDFDGKTSQHFDDSKWFTRGWTLQELLAPDRIYFYDRYWRSFSDVVKSRKICVETQMAFWTRLPTITGIPASVFTGAPLEEFSIAQRMSWVANRRTTRPEDIAYCLLGVFDVNMPLLYGEGSKRAFMRLQEEIIKQSNDMSIFAWKSPSVSETKTSGILAPLPSYFRSSGTIESQAALAVMPEFTMTNKGLRIQTRLHRVRRDTIISLHCGTPGYPPLGIFLENLDGVFVRAQCGMLTQAGKEHESGEEQIYIRKMY